MRKMQRNKVTKLKISKVKTHQKAKPSQDKPPTLNKPFHRNISYDLCVMFIAN